MNIPSTFLQSVSSFSLTHHTVSYLENELQLLYEILQSGSLDSSCAQLMRMGISVLAMLFGSHIICINMLLFCLIPGEMGSLISDKDDILTLTKDYLVNLLVLLPEGSSTRELIECELFWHRVSINSESYFTTLDLLTLLTEPIKQKLLDICDIEEGSDKLLLRTVTAVTQTPENLITTIRLRADVGVELPDIPGFNLVKVDFDKWSPLIEANYHVVSLLSESINPFLRFCFRPGIGQ